MDNYLIIRNDICEGKIEFVYLYTNLHEITLSIPVEDLLAIKIDLDFETFQDYIISLIPGKYCGKYDVVLNAYNKLNQRIAIDKIYKTIEVLKRDYEFIEKSNKTMEKLPEKDILLIEDCSLVIEHITSNIEFLMRMNNEIGYNLREIRNEQN